jgi:hypothetical protein
MGLADKFKFDNLKAHFTVKLGLFSFVRDFCRIDVRLSLRFTSHHRD